jgi:ATP-dependent DNA helicase PIF1
MLPRIKLIHTANQDFSGTFSRYQFPIAPAFAMTINKSQGQSFNTVAVFLPRPAFAHGQLYVALSCTTSVDRLYVGLVQENESDRSTYNVAHLDILRRLNQNNTMMIQ